MFQRVISFPSASDSINYGWFIMHGNASPRNSFGHFNWQVACKITVVVIKQITRRHKQRLNNAIYTATRYHFWYLNINEILEIYFPYFAANRFLKWHNTNKNKTCIRSSSVQYVHLSIKSGFSWQDICTCMPTHLLSGAGDVSLRATVKQFGVHDAVSAEFQVRGVWSGGGWGWWWWDVWMWCGFTSMT